MTSELWRFLKQEGLDSKIKRWKKKLMLIEAVLADAEDKQTTNTAVKIWLDDLRDLVYDVEDILDEFATEALARKLKIQEHNQQASSSKVGKFLPICFGNWSPRAIKFRRSVDSAIEDVTSRLEELYKLGDELGLREIAIAPSSSSIDTVYWRLPTTSLPTEPAIYGRDQDKDRVIQMVMKEDKDDVRFCVTAIVGMGGLGKTTLAREVYNDARLKDFELKAWVCISEDFEVLRISNAILRSTSSSSCDYKDLNIVQNKLKEAVTGKKFFLVLDDVWSKDYMLWETLKSPFMAALEGSKIIVTTRLAEVALMMNPGEFYELKLLSDDDCWSLFSKHAFQSRNTSVFPDNELIRRKVVEKCKGLPLTVKILGGLLRSKQGEDKWLDLLNSNLWESCNDTEIPGALKLSYYHLPSTLKRCFALCAVLPKDCEFEKELLIHLWMAEGLLLKPNECILPEDLGRDYFEDLVSRSIFQKSSEGNKDMYVMPYSVSTSIYQESSDGKDKYLMHDLVSDLAQWAAGKTCFSLDASWVDREQSNLGKFRHYSYVCGFTDKKNQFEVLMSKAEQDEHLRTFLPLPRFSHQKSYIPQTVLHDLLPKFSKLRALSLISYHITVLPESIGQLKHLRYFNLSFTEIRSLPESTCCLVNLQIMKLRNCFFLRKLPSKMSNLINLRHLDIRGAGLSEMPSGMKKLKFLRVLTNFIVGKGRGAGIEDLKYFKFLQGELCISRLENVMYPKEKNEFILWHMGINVLQLKWDSRNDDTWNEAVDKRVIDMLQPPPDVKELTIKCYGGVEFPRWLRDSMHHMTILRLENCEKCPYLPSLGSLRSLKELIIIGLKSLKSIGDELHGDHVINNFPSLETLCFKDLQEWELWEPAEGNVHVHVFPRLRRLSIVKCMKLLGKLPNVLPSLEVLVIKELRSWLFRPQVFQFSLN